MGGLKEYLFGFVLDSRKLESPRVKLGLDFGLKSHYFLLYSVKGRPPGDGIHLPAWGGSCPWANANSLLLLTSQG